MPQALVLAAQTGELFALAAGDPVVALSRVKLTSFDQLRSDCGDKASASATCGIDRPAGTIATASRRASSGYASLVLGIDGHILSRPALASHQMSVKAGELQFINTSGWFVMWKDGVVSRKVPARQLVNVLADVRKVRRVC